MCAASVFWRRDSVLKPGTVRVSPTSRSRLSHKAGGLNRPLFTGERLVGMLGCFFIWVQGFIEHLLCVMRRDISGGAVQALGVVPIDPL